MTHPPPPLAHTPTLWHLTNRSTACVKKVLVKRGGGGTRESLTSAAGGREFLVHVHKEETGDEGHPLGVSDLWG